MHLIGLLCHGSNGMFVYVFIAEVLNVLFVTIYVYLYKNTEGIVFKLVVLLVLVMLAVVNVLS